jgi:hypothetical protein
MMRHGLSLGRTGLPLGPLGIYEGLPRRAEHLGDQAEILSTFSSFQTLFVVQGAALDVQGVQQPDFLVWEEGIHDAIIQRIEDLILDVQALGGQPRKHIPPIPLK